MLVKIGWAGCPDREGVNSRVAEAKQSIELHRGKWRGCLRKLGGGAIEHSSFVIRADDKNSHVVLMRRL